MKKWEKKIILAFRQKAKSLKQEEIPIVIPDFSAVCFYAKENEITYVTLKGKKI